MDATMQSTFDHETVGMLEHEIHEYLGWMADNAYSQATQGDYRRTLGQLLSFVRSGRYHWNDVFTYETMMLFKNRSGLSHLHGVSGFTRYLFAKGKIATPRPMRKPPPPLPAIYEDYLVHHKRYRQATDIAVTRIRRVLSAFDAYCQQSGIPLRSLRIEHIDAVNDRLNGATHDRRNGASSKWKKSSLRTGQKLWFFTPFQSGFFRLILTCYFYRF